LSTPIDKRPLKLAIAGRVIVEDVGAPVPRVVVEAFDMTKSKKSKSGRLTDADVSWVVTEPSLGSAMTDDAGEFGWTVEHDACPIPMVVPVFEIGPKKDPELLKLAERVRMVELEPRGYFRQIGRAGDDLDAGGQWLGVRKTPSGALGGPRLSATGRLRAASSAKVHRTRRKDLQGNPRVARAGTVH
jgi:hypothetical protein